LEPIDLSQACNERKSERERDRREEPTYRASKCANKEGDDEGPRNETAEEAAAVAASALRVEKECRPLEAIVGDCCCCCLRSRSRANARPAIAGCWLLATGSARRVHPPDCGYGRSIIVNGCDGAGSIAAERRAWRELGC